MSSNNSKRFELPYIDEVPIEDETVYGMTAPIQRVMGAGREIDISMMPWVANMTFNAIDYNIVSWTAGTITLEDGSSYDIARGNTGVMSSYMPALQGATVDAVYFRDENNGYSPDAPNETWHEWKHTIDAGENRAIIVYFSIYAYEPNHPVRATYAGIEMTKFAGPIYASNNSWFGYILLNPPTGINTVSLECGRSDAAVGYSISMTGVDQDDPISKHNPAYWVYPTDFLYNNQRYEMDIEVPDDDSLVILHRFTNSGANNGSIVWDNEIGLPRLEWGYSSIELGYSNQDQHLIDNRYKAGFTTLGDENAYVQASSAGFTVIRPKPSLVPAPPTYIYLDTNVSDTVLQTTIDPEDAVGAGKLIIAVAKVSLDENTLATVQVFSGGDISINETNIVDGSITPEKLKAGFSGLEMLPDLPTTGNFTGRAVYLTSDNLLYIYDGSSFVAI